MKVFNDLKTRGVADILIAVTDGLKGIPQALPLRQNSCRPNRTKTLGGGDERQKWLDTDKHSKTKR
jgi:hypothetical protein